MMMRMIGMKTEGEKNRVHGEASLTLEILGEGKDVQHKAQISSIMFIILSYCTVV